MKMWRERVKGLVLFVMTAVFFFGVILFWDGPIRECRNHVGYCGKGERPHTAQMYHLYKIWETIIWIVWPVGFVTAIVLQKWQPKK